MYSDVANNMILLLVVQNRIWKNWCDFILGMNIISSWYYFSKTLAHMTDKNVQYVFLPSCSKSISRPFLRRTFDSQNSDVFSWSEGGGPCSIPPRQRPTANATERSRSSSQTHLHSSSCCSCPRHVLSSHLSVREIPWHCETSLLFYVNNMPCYDWKCNTVLTTDKKNNGGKNLWVKLVDQNSTDLSEPQSLVPVPPGGLSLGATCWNHWGAPTSPINGWGGVELWPGAAGARSTLPGTAGCQPLSCTTPLGQGLRWERGNRMTDKNNWGIQIGNTYKKQSRGLNHRSYYKCLSSNQLTLKCWPKCSTYMCINVWHCLLVIKT